MTLLIALLFVGQLRAPGKPVVSGAGTVVDPTTWRGAVMLGWDAVPDALVYRVHIRADVYVAPFYYEVHAPRFGTWEPLHGGSRGETPVADGTVFWFSVSAVNRSWQEGPRSPELQTVYRVP